MGGQTADTILLGNVLVLDRAGSTAEAIAIAGGRIPFVANLWTS